MKRAPFLTLCTILLTLPAGPLLAQGEKPAIAVLKFANEAEIGDRSGTASGWWHDRGAAVLQNHFIAALKRGGTLRVIDRKRIDAATAGWTLSGDVDPSTAARLGKRLGADYMLVGSVTEYGVVRPPGSDADEDPERQRGGQGFVAAADARIIDAQTGEILWADEARARVSMDGFGGGADEGPAGDDRRTFDKVMKPIVQELTASIKAADL